MSNLPSELWGNNKSRNLCASRKQNLKVVKVGENRENENVQDGLLACVVSQFWHRQLAAPVPEWGWNSASSQSVTPFDCFVITDIKSRNRLLLVKAGRSRIGCPRKKIHSRITIWKTCLQLRSSSVRLGFCNHLCETIPKPSHISWSVWGTPPTSSGPTSSQPTINNGPKSYLWRDCRYQS